MFIYKTHLPSPPSMPCLWERVGWGLTRLRPPSAPGGAWTWAGPGHTGPRPHAESSGAWVEERQSVSEVTTPVQSVHVFLQGLQAGIYFGHVSRSGGLSCTL